MYLRQFIAVLLLACAFGVAAAAAAGVRGSETITTTAATATVPVATAPEPPVTGQPEDLTPDSVYIRQILRLKRETWRWQALMGVPRTMTAGRDLRAAGKGTLRDVRAKWRRFRRRAHVRAHNPPHKSAWLCLQRYEASWTDTGAPYYGGLQMDWSFMSSYGGRLLRTKGPASNWTPLEQMWVAERAYRSGRGFSPWPNTARYCGLL